MVSEQPLASIIILNLNGKKYLRDCLQAVFSQSLTDFEVILVDNGSNDDSVNFTEENFPQVKVIKNENNLGFAKANNQGFEMARGKYIVTLNNDTVVEKDWLENLVEIAVPDNKIGMCASKILSIYNKKEIDSVGINICLDGMARGRGRNELDKGQYDKAEEILLPSACAALYKREMLEEVGFFDEDFFAYCEDVDLGLRGRWAGWEAVSAPSAIAYHHYSSTSGKYSPLKAYLVERNHLWVLLKCFPISLLLILPFFTIYRFFLQIISVFIGKGSAAEFSKQANFGGMLSSVASAYWDALKKAPVFLKKRRVIQKKRKLSNKEFKYLLRKFRLSFKELVFKK
jgi:GT2 family glycosyltransferase